MAKSSRQLSRAQNKRVFSLVLNEYDNDMAMEAMESQVSVSFTEDYFLGIDENYYMDMLVESLLFLNIDRDVRTNDNDMEDYDDEPVSYPFYSILTDNSYLY
jgi:hypothetical protein